MVHEPRAYTDVNAVAGGYLRDLAFAQWSQQKMFGYKRAAAAILSLDLPRQDLAYTTGRRALTFGGIFALDSDAHHGAVVLCRDSGGARATCRHFRRPDRQLLATGAIGGLVVESVIRECAAMRGVNPPAERREGVGLLCARDPYMQCDNALRSPQGSIGPS
jgi:hypothetical protein